jgi:ABC-type branched-subunit amino acid transport system substrate-binding protein
VKSAPSLDKAGLEWWYAAKSRSNGLFREELHESQAFSGRGVRGLVFSAAQAALAQDSVKIGFILPMTGQQQSTGKQIAAAIKLYMAQNGDTVAGKKVELLIKNDGAVPDSTKRIAQEMIVNHKVTLTSIFARSRRRTANSITSSSQPSRT